MTLSNVRLVQQIVLTTVASLSCFASTLIAIMILRSHNGLKSPYSRIIFGLSIADIMQSAGILTLSFAVPIDTPDAPWAMGNTEACETVGFFLNIGVTAVPLYTLFLSYYFLKRVKDRMTPQEFARKYEFNIHALIWLFPVIGGSVALARKDFNPSKNGALCIMMDNPVDCSADPETYGSCIRGENAPKDSVFLVAVPFALTFVMLIVNLLRFTLHVYSQERLIRLEARRSDRDNADSSQGCKDKLKAAIIGCCNSKESDPQDQDTTQSLSMQALVQSSLYIFAYFLAYSGPILVSIMSVSGMARPRWVSWLGAIFWPVGGFFNVLIYTRPKVSAMQKMYPVVRKHSSWFAIFLLIVFGGGEVPTNLKFEDEVRSKDENGNEYADMVASNANRLVFPVVLVPQRDEGLNILLSTNPDLGHSNGRSMIDSGETEIQLRRDLEDSSGADSFLREFHQEFGDC